MRKVMAKLLIQRRAVSRSSSGHFSASVVMYGKWETVTEFVRYIDAAMYLEGLARGGYEYRLKHRSKIVCKLDGPCVVDIVDRIRRRHDLAEREWSVEEDKWINRN